MNTTTPRLTSRSLFPLFCFLIVFLGSGVYFNLSGDEFGFYSMSPAWATIPAILLAAWQSRSNIHQFLRTFILGTVEKNLLTMCLIFLLAGAFSAVAKSSGGVEAAVNFGLMIIPDGFILPGIFIITAFIATAMGTSVGTIAAISPVALGIADSLNMDHLLVAGAVISGAMFGDNLSIISDTTIAATRTQGCRPKDKFKENLLIALPAAIITALIFYRLSYNNPLTMILPIDTIKILPYLLILILAICGINVFIVLICGLVSAGIIGIISIDSYEVSTLFVNIQQGAWSMRDITLLSMLIGGLGAVMESQGGLLYIKQRLDSLFAFVIKGGQKKANRLKGELGIASLVTISNLATANNTIAIILSGRAAKLISSSYQITAKRTASLLDIFSCVIQGLIPWGAQMLLLSASFSLSPFSSALYSFYPIALAVVTLGFIFLKP